MLDMKDGRSIDADQGSTRFGKHLAAVSEIDVDFVLAALRRQRRVIVTGMIVGAVLSLVYAVTAAPRYTAHAEILIETPRFKALTDLSDSGSSGLAIDTGAIDSQVSVLESERIALGVIKKLDLKNDRRFNPPPAYLLQMIATGVDAVRDFIGIRDPQEEALVATAADQILERRIIGQLARSLDVKRLGKSFVLEMNYTGGDAELSARITNAFADQYLVDQLDAKFDATSRAAVWLQDRIAELRGKVLAADTKVQKFRSDNGLIAVGDRLIDEQQLSDANTQLTDARSKLSEADARVARIDSIVQSGNVDAVVSESLSSSVVAGLRTKYLDASKREAEISKRLGPSHIAAVNLRSEMSQYEKLLFEELGRIGQSYRSDAQIAKANIASLESNLKKQLDQTSANNQTLVTLRELEREADTYKALYQTFLTRYQEAIQQQSFPINDARVITAASAPLAPSWPKKSLILAGGLFLGLFAGAGTGFARELRDRTFRTGNQVENDLGLEFIGLLPLVIDTDTGRGVRGAFDHVLTEPLSGFAETLRAAKVTADIALRGKSPKIIGMISVLPDEGKTTVSKNFASLLASLGARTVLVDADLRRPGLSQKIASGATDGLVEILTGRKTLQEVAIHESETGLTIVPTVSGRRSAATSELLGSEQMRAFIERLGSSFDYIVVDLPPLGPVIDVRAAADMFDAFLLVVEWGKTPRGVVHATLDSEPEIMEKCLGVVLNKVDRGRIGLYDGGQYRNYYHSAYSKYHSNR